MANRTRGYSVSLRCAQTAAACLRTLWVDGRRNGKAGWVSKVGEDAAQFTIECSDGSVVDVTCRKRWPNGRPEPEPKLPPGRPRGDYYASRVQVALERDARIIASQSVRPNRRLKKDELRQRFTQAD